MQVVLTGGMETIEKENKKVVDKCIQDNYNRFCC